MPETVLFVGGDDSLLASVQQTVHGDLDVHFATSVTEDLEVDALVVDGALLADHAAALFRLREGGWKGRLFYVADDDGHTDIVRRLHAERLARASLEADSSLSELLLSVPREVTSSEPPIRPLLSARLRATRREFELGLRRRVQELGEALTDTSAAPLLQALRLSHRLHGTAGSYGFTEVSQLSGRLEHAIERIRARGSTPASEEWRELFALHDALTRAVPEPKADAVPEPELEVTGTEGRVLVVDDDPEFVRHMGLLGARCGVLVYGASGTKEALTLAEEVTFDGAFVDVFLEVEEGFGLGRMLRASQRNRGLPVVYISVRSDLPNRLAAASSGGFAFVEKPVFTNTFADLVGQMHALHTDARPRVLIVETTPDVSASVFLCLDEAGVRVTRLPDPLELLDALARVEPEAVVLDVEMPWLSAFDACRMIRGHRRWQDLPILFVADQTSTRMRVACMDAGGDDVLNRSMRPDEIIARVRHRIRRHRMRTERLETEPVTGLLRRRPFLARAQNLLDDAARHGRPLSVAVVGIEGFERARSRHGPRAAEQMVASLGSALRGDLRGIDQAARWTDATCVIALPGLRADEAETVAERFRTQYARYEFHGQTEIVFRAKLSTGIACHPVDGHSIAALIRCGQEHRRQRV